MIYYHSIWLIKPVSKIKYVMTPLNKDIFFSIIIPAYNEENNIEATLTSIAEYFEKKSVFDYEVVVINDNSNDQTESILKRINQTYPCIRYVNNTPPNGIGYAIRQGLESFQGQSVCIVMADLSDSPEDIYKYYGHLKAGNECVFGSRFISGSKVTGYPIHKLILNRFANWFIKFLFSTDHNDITNAFKAYRREVIEGILPIISCHFNITVELPLKAIVRGYLPKKIPISWINKRKGLSNLRIQEMGSRYLFIILYIYLEKRLSMGDYMRKMQVHKK